jgi:hypothetical protein
MQHKAAAAGDLLLQGLQLRYFCSCVADHGEWVLVIKSNEAVAKGRVALRLLCECPMKPLLRAGWRCVCSCVSAQ